jgi:chemotaxis protein methyltransferase CheR
LRRSTPRTIVSPATSGASRNNFRNFALRCSASSAPTPAGTRAFSEYYSAAYDGAQFDRSLVRNVVFAQHNLVSDRSFNEFHAIVCRNVMIYFDRSLQEKVLELFHESLVRFGVLALGHKETLRFTRFADAYEELDADERLYRKVQ